MVYVLRKKRIKEGTVSLPKTGNDVIINCLIKNEVFDKVINKQFRFKIGSNQVIKGLEIGAKTMKVGEKAEFIFSQDYASEIEKIFEIVEITFEFEIELLKIIIPKTKNLEMTYEEKLKEAKKIKEEGVEKFKSKNIVEAINLFEKTKKYLEEINEIEIEGANLYIATLSNLCNCYNQQKEYYTIIKYATKGLELKELPKFYYFRAIAYANTDEINLAKKDLENLKVLLDENKRETDEGIKFLNDLIEKRIKIIIERRKKYSKRIFSINNDLQNTDNIKNYIIAEINIEEYDIGKDINIINSYENANKKKNPNFAQDREIREKCIIKINNKRISFSYCYKFEKKGKYKIEYFFIDPLTKTNDLFSDCGNITKIDLSNFDSQKVTDMNHMFLKCFSLININFSNFNTQNVTNMIGMFCDCKSLKSLDLSSFNTENVINMGYMFYECNSLKSINLSSFNTQNVKYITNLFFHCRTIKTLNLSNFNTKKIDDMSYMFGGCESLTLIDLSNFNTENVTNMTCMFFDCFSLYEINLSNFNTQNVKSMKYMFGGCKALTEINLSNFNTENVFDMSYMFYKCNSLVTINVSSFNIQKCIEMNNMFCGCNSLIAKTYFENFGKTIKGYITEFEVNLLLKKSNLKYGF